MIYIFVSKKHDYTEQVHRVLSHNDLNGRRIYIEDIIKSKTALDDLITEIQGLSTQPVIYFLCNNTEIPRIIELLKDDAICLNRKFYSRYWDKEQMFTVLQGIKTSLEIPYHYNNKADIMDNEYPIYVKSNMHQGITFESKNCDMINGFEFAVDLDDYYFEKKVSSDTSKEIKVFYLKGEIMPSDKDKEKYNECLKYNPQLSESLDKIAKYFKLDFCSVDIIFDKDKQYLIDLNSAPGYYTTQYGTEKFSKVLLEYIK